MATATIDMPLAMPEAMVPYVSGSDEGQTLVRNAMILYPHIRNLEMSHGFAAELLGISKLDLIELYGSLGMPYLHQTKESLMRELGEHREELQQMWDEQQIEKLPPLA